MMLSSKNRRPVNRIGGSSVYARLAGDVIEPPHQCNEQDQGKVRRRHEVVLIDASLFGNLVVGVIDGGDFRVGHHDKFFRQALGNQQDRDDFRAPAGDRSV